jgi:hypothetical protein
VEPCQLGAGEEHLRPALPLAAVPADHVAAEPARGHDLPALVGASPV